MRLTSGELDRCKVGDEPVGGRTRVKVARTSALHRSAKPSSRSAGGAASTCRPSLSTSGSRGILVEKAGNHLSFAGTTLGNGRERFARDVEREPGAGKPAARGDRRRRPDATGTSQGRLRNARLTTASKRNRWVRIVAVWKHPLLAAPTVSSLTAVLTPVPGAQGASGSRLPALRAAGSSTKCRKSGSSFLYLRLSVRRAMERPIAFAYAAARDTTAEQSLLRRRSEGAPRLRRAART